MLVLKMQPQGVLTKISILFLALRTQSGASRPAVFNGGIADKQIASLQGDD